MNCIWEEIPNTTDERGWRKTRCRRCGRATAPWPSDQTHDRSCPVPGWADWIAHAAQIVAGIDHVIVSWLLVNWRAYLLLCLRYVVVIVGTYVPQQSSSGPGTILESMLKRVGGYQAGTCKTCASRVEEMNLGGPAWCRQSTATIVGWLKESADRARLPFSELAATLLVRRAIAIASRKR